MKPGMHVDNLHVERTSRFEQEKNGKDNIMMAFLCAMWTGRHIWDSRI